MTDQPQPQQTDNRIALTGGIYPCEDGTWRVATWFSKIATEAQANHLSGWIQGLIAANVTPNPQSQPSAPPKDEQGITVNGSGST